MEPENNVSHPETATPAEPVAAAPVESSWSYILSFVTQQLLEELGRAKSTESEENAALLRELERLRADALSMEEVLTEMQSAHVLLQAALGGFGEQLYQLAMKEEERQLADPLRESGLLARAVSAQLADMKDGLGALASGLRQQVKAIQDARDTRETYRMARLAYDSSERAAQEAARSGKNVEAANAERDRMLARYRELAEAVKTKVMLLHQYRIRTLKRQLEELRALFDRVFTSCVAKLPAKPGAALSAETHTKAVSALLAN